MILKMWGNKDINFCVGDHIAVNNVVVDHFQSQVSLNSTDDTETSVCYYDGFLCTYNMNCIKIIQIKKSVI